MNLKSVLEAEFEAKRFLEKLNDVRKTQDVVFTKEKNWFDTSKETAALKRSSMDLTRSLAKLRKSD